MSTRVAVVGCGRMGAFTTDATRAYLPPCWLPLSHVDAAMETDGFELVAVAESDAAQLERALARTGLPAAAGFSDVESLLDGVKPDILTIATRTPGRVESIVLACERGVRAIHAEKPLAFSYGAAIKANDALAANAAALTVGTLRRFMAPYRRARDIVASGEIGALRTITVEHGRDLLLWGHPHSVDLASFIAGSPVRAVRATCDLSDCTVDDNIVDGDPVVELAELHLDDGTLAVITTAPGMTVRIGGDAGTVVVHADGSHVEVRTAAAGSPYFLQHRTEQPVAPSGTAQALIELRAFLHGGTRPSQTIDDIIGTQRALMAIARSSVEGSRLVAVDEIDPAFRVTGRFRGMQP